MWAGVFGHTHRAKWYRSAPERGNFLPCTEGALDRRAVHVLNTGAVGQPRDRENPTPHVLWLTLSEGVGLVAGFAMQPFAYDLDGYLRRVRSSGLSEGAVAKILAFFSELV